MTKPGPRPKPTEVKRMTGVEPGRINEATPLPPMPAIVPKPPEFLGKVAKGAWRRLAPHLHATGLLTHADLDAFAVLCEAIEQYRAASKVVQQYGVVLTDNHGHGVKNPAFQVCRDTSQTIRSYAAEFGLTPAARSQIVMPPEVTPDEAVRLLA